MPKQGPFDSMEEFYPYYLTQHSLPITKVFHVIGTLLNVFWTLYVMYTV